MCAWCPAKGLLVEVVVGLACCRHVGRQPRQDLRVLGIEVEDEGADQVIFMDVVMSLLVHLCNPFYHLFVVSWCWGITW